MVKWKSKINTALSIIQLPCRFWEWGQLLPTNKKIVKSNKKSYRVNNLRKPFCHYNIITFEGQDINLNYLNGTAKSTLKSDWGGVECISFQGSGVGVGGETC